MFIMRNRWWIQIKGPHRTLQNVHWFAEALLTNHLWLCYHYSSLWLRTPDKKLLQARRAYFGSQCGGAVHSGQSMVAEAWGCLSTSARVRREGTSVLSWPFHPPLGGGVDHSHSRPCLVNPLWKNPHRHTLTEAHGFLIQSSWPLELITALLHKDQGTVVGLHTL